MVNAQEWLDKNYPREKRSEIEKLNIELETLKEERKIKNDDLRGLEGSLDLSDFIDLKELKCYENKLTSLDLSSCEKLVKLDCSKNQLTNLILPAKGKNLTNLILNNNWLKDLNVFSHYENLEKLYLRGDPFAGSLESLKNYQKLKELDINNTNLSPTWEYLPKIEEIGLLESNVNEELQPYLINTDLKGINHYNLRSWRQNQSGYKWLKETLLKINPDLNINEIINQFEFFNVKTGSFYGDLNNLIFLFSKSQEEQYFLRKTIGNLIKLIKEQKEKIIQAYSHFCSEKELLQGLIQTHLEYSKAREKKETIIDLRRKRNKILDELEEKLGEEQMEKVDFILKDCEELVRVELELENKISYNRLIEEIGKEFTNLTITVKQGHALIGNQLGENINFSRAISYQQESGITRLLEDEFQEKSQHLEVELTQTKFTEEESLGKRLVEAKKRIQELELEIRLLEKEKILSLQEEETKNLEEKLKLKEEFQKKEKELLEDLITLQRVNDATSGEGQLIAQQLEKYPKIFGDNN